MREALARQTIHVAGNCWLGRMTFENRRSSSSSSSSSTGERPMQSFIAGKLTMDFSPIHLEVLNESHGGQHLESHFKVVIVADKFTGQPLLKQHRMVKVCLRSIAFVVVNPKMTTDCRCRWAHRPSTNTIKVRSRILLVLLYCIYKQAALQNESGELPFHSLSIVSFPPEKWASSPDGSNKVPASPRCSGGDGPK